ncbi:GRASP55/65 family protein [Colletotrichum scovillei]|uniref:GRASP55/65 family protein n=1 Tax=Colletotrichum scovillei TaxID=1209932 RepID=A0A9P7UD36_9PEZI|nr:GRASP55/65 family protein [Colletotrichum scovillei]KAF4782516.1 GRASP55/65 family protein [Colletotrichum scovillei]KAG7050691.1 GRASP55/65 family protein [Colletotrichum scovillei]KAG7069737.1 GRASP55/65 family protein [Colletotrichum scovillei]KAG7073683.1 GRASP55/65 family protein [Colletotrichum scovillei]
MFNALNRFMSRLDGQQPTQQNNQGSFGFQVLRNTNLELNVEPWFDFIIGINGRPIDNPDPSLFAQEVRNCAGGSVSLGLWSAKGQRTRELHALVPHDTASLGLSLQWTPLAVAANIWHVLDVAANSPADGAGLLPYGDYILGSPEGALHGEGGLSELVEDHIGRPLRLYVYNNEYDVTREVTIQPTREWGGEGALGCVLGYGALHRLPAPLNEPVDAPGEMMFDAGGEKADPAAALYGNAGPVGEVQQNLFSPATPGLGAPPPPTGGDFLVPAQMMGAGAAAPPPPAGTATTRKKKERHHGGNNNFMDDYFKEEEKKSREADNAPSGRGTPVAPPPKMGGPPPPPRAGSTGPPKDQPAAEGAE